MTEPKKEPQVDVHALLAELEQAYRRKQDAYNEFVESIQCHDRRIKADEWMAYTARNIDTYGDQEALVYRQSRGHKCKQEIDELMSDWKRAARDRIDECAKGISVLVLETGETKREGGIPISKASDVSNVSPYLLPNFWSGSIEQSFSIDATMLRTVEWCDIGGFNEWWERFARSTMEDIIQGVIDSIPGSFWLFSMSRSDYAIELMGSALDRALEAIELPVHDEPHPWRVLRELDAEGQRVYCPVDHIPYASTVVFANMRLRSGEHNRDIVKQAAETLLKTQHEDGAWPCWADSKCASVMASAMCIHALALAKPRGWQSSVARACEWLWSKQKRSGCWVEHTFPDLVYLSVLVLDALDLADGKQPVTFGRQGLKHTTKETRQSSANSAKRILLVSVTSNERQAILKQLASLGIVPQPQFDEEFEGHVFNYSVGQSGSAQIFMIRLQGQGPIETGIKVSKEVERLKPDAVLMVGMCMGIKLRVEKHDVLVPIEIVSIAHARDTKVGTKPIPHFFRANAMAHRRLSMIVDTTQFQFGVHQKQLGCGPQKEEDPDGWIVNYLKDYSTDVLGYEMEAEGFYRALEEQKVEALFIKGVADFGDFSDHQGLSAEERSKEKKKSQSQAVCNALDVALKWVEHFIQFPRS